MEDEQPISGAAEPPLDQELRTGLPAPVGQPKTHGVGAFEAHLITQGLVKRGLRGGREVLDAARSTYLQTEWSGPSDRRPPKGRITRTKV